VQLGPYAFPGDIIVGIREGLAGATLDLGGPCRFDLIIGLAVQASEQVGRKLGALGNRQRQGVLQQLAGSLGHRSQDSRFSVALTRELLPPTVRAMNDQDIQGLADLFDPIRAVLRAHRGLLTDYQILGLFDERLRDQCIARWGDAGVGGGRKPGAAAIVGMACNRLHGDDNEHIVKAYVNTSLVQFRIGNAVALPSHSEICAAFAYVG